LQGIPPDNSSDAGASSPPAPTAARPQAEPFLYSAFIGPDGLRAGWRFAIYLAAFFALLFLISSATKPFLHLHPHQQPPLWVFLLGELDSLVAALIPALVMAKFERRRFGLYGLPIEVAFRKQFWVGMGWGICAITLLLLLMRGVGVFYFGALALHGVRILKLPAFW